MRLVAELIQVDLLDGEVIFGCLPFLLRLVVSSLVIEEYAHILTLVLSDGVRVDVVAKSTDAIPQQRLAVNGCRAFFTFRLGDLVMSLDSLVKNQLALLLVVVYHIVDDLA